jgi:molecular chaperone GrpE
MFKRGAKDEQPTDAAAAGPDEPQANDAAVVSEADQTVEPLAALRREVAELREKNLRTLAESRNLQQRFVREKEQALKYAEADLARELLVVLDDFERTLESAAQAPDAAAVADGVRIVYEHFVKVLRNRDIEPIEALGKPFDPDLHEALLQQPSAEQPAGTVMQELARGYKMHDRVLRPTRVVVSTGPAAEQEAERD